MIQSNHPFGLLLRRQICLNPVWLGGLAKFVGVCLAGGLRSSASLQLTLGPFGLTTYASPHSPPTKQDSDKFGDSTADETGWLD